VLIIGFASRCAVCFDLPRFKALAGFLNLLQTIFSTRKLCGHFIAPAVLPVALVLLCVGLGRLPHPLSDLFPKALPSLLPPAVAHRLVLARVRLRAVYRHSAPLHQTDLAGPLSGLYGLHEDVSKLGKVSLTIIRNRAVRGKFSAASSR
jgi:hypothetical protein